jgi:hypothetical protein
MDSCFTPFARSYLNHHNEECCRDRIVVTLLVIIVSLLLLLLVMHCMLDKHNLAHWLYFCAVFTLVLIVAICGDSLRISAQVDAAALFGRLGWRSGWNFSLTITTATVQGLTYRSVVEIVITIYTTGWRGRQRTVLHRVFEISTGTRKRFTGLWNFREI